MFEIVMNWFILPLIVLAVGLMYKKNPPDKANRAYGFRTKRAMKNQMTWDFANKTFADLMVKAGIAELIFSAVTFCFFAKNLYITFAVIALEATTILVLVIVTEVKLRKRFDKNGMRIISRNEQ